MVKLKNIMVTSDASGAQLAARQGYLVMIVDVIDMSTTLESALDAGALAVFGASPDFTKAPVKVNPKAVAREAARIAIDAGTGIVIVAEPRVGEDSERLARCQKLLGGLGENRGLVEAIVPNMGAETPKLIKMENRVVVAVTDTGGVAFDAAWNVSRQVTVATVARTFKLRGTESALKAADRALNMLRTEDSGIAIVAASRNSLEDVLAAQYISTLFLQTN